MKIIDAHHHTWDRTVFPYSWMDDPHPVGDISHFKENYLITDLLDDAKNQNLIKSDILSINCALTEETKHIVNEEKLSLMKKSSYLINTSRGPVVDQDALYNCLASNKIAGAGLDVFEKEPLDTDEKILKLENVILAPHSLCWTDQMFNKCGEDDMRATIDVMHGKIPKNIVNKEIINDKTWINKLENYKKNFQIYN